MNKNKTIAMQIELPEKTFIDILLNATKIRKSNLGLNSGVFFIQSGASRIVLKLEQSRQIVSGIVYAELLKLVGLHSPRIAIVTKECETDAVKSVLDLDLGKFDGLGLEGAKEAKDEFEDQLSDVDRHPVVMEYASGMPLKTLMNRPSRFMKSLRSKSFLIQLGQGMAMDALFKNTDRFYFVNYGNLLIELKSNRISYIDNGIYPDKEFLEQISGELKQFEEDLRCDREFPRFKTLNGMIHTFLDEVECVFPSMNDKEIGWLWQNKTEPCGKVKLSHLV